MPEPQVIYRHRLSTRLWHWINALAVFVLLMSGLMISNAHPRLYWGQYGANFDVPWLDLTQWLPRGHFPGWATIPSAYNLALARLWHMAFAWIFVLGFLFYTIVSMKNRHFWRDIIPQRAELAPSHLWHDIKKHLRLDFHEAGGRYNPLQKITYALVLVVLLPLAILSGLTLSPAIDAAWPWLLDLFGGRASARSIHFLCAMGLGAFIVVHLALVVLAGPINEIRSMITGRFVVKEAQP